MEDWKISNFSLARNVRELQVHMFVFAARPFQNLSCCYVIFSRQLKKISIFETCGLTVSVVWSCWWRNRFNVTGQFMEKKLVQDKSSPLAHKKFTGTAYERCLKVLAYMCGWCSGEFCPTELSYKNCLFLYVQEINTQLTFKLWCVSYREIVGLGMNSLISRKDIWYKLTVLSKSVKREDSLTALLLDMISL